jgi:hypothetical protein
MNQLLCPHCGQQGISVGRKLFLGSAIPAICKVCGKKVGVPYGKSFAALIPFFVWIIGRFYININWVEFVSFLVALAISCVLYIKWVPLIKR